MGAYANLETGPSDIFLDQNPQHLASERSPAPADKQPGRFGCPLHQARPRLDHVVSDGRNGRLSKRYDPLPISFADALAERRVEMNVRELQVNDFGGPAARGVKYLQ